MCILWLKWFIESAVEAENAPNQYGTVEAIAEAFPYDPSIIQETPEQDSRDSANNNQNEVIPLTVIKTQPENPTTTAPKKVHVALDVPADDEAADDELYYSKRQKAQQPQQPQTPMMFPVNFGGIDDGSTIAVANAYNAGGGPVRSHAIAYGIPDSEARRRSNRRTVQRKQAHANSNSN